MAQRPHTDRQKQAQKRLMPFFNDHTQQPPNVVTGCAQHRMQTVAQHPSQVAPVHSVICFHVSNDGLDGLSPLEIFFVFIRRTFQFTPVLDVYVGVGFVHPPVAQVNDGLVRFGVQGLHEVAGLFHLLAERVPDVRIALEGSGTHDQSALER